VQPLEADIVVLAFTRTDCPISNRYAPELARIHARFSAPRTVFWLVYVDRTQDAGVLRRHRLEYAYPFGAIADRKHELVKRSRAQTTPQVAVFRRGVLVYTGRIDDRHVDYGRSRSSPSTHDLEDVLAALQTGASVPFRMTKAVGCSIEDVR
jgi:hypothetical protein